MTPYLGVKHREQSGQHFQIRKQHLFFIVFEEYSISWQREILSNGWLYVSERVVLTLQFKHSSVALVLHCKVQGLFGQTIRTIMKDNNQITVQCNCLKHAHRWRLSRFESFHLGEGSYLLSSYSLLALQALCYRIYLVPNCNAVILVIASHLSLKSSSLSTDGFSSSISLFARPAN